jgi:hypothetical protein
LPAVRGVATVAVLASLPFGGCGDDSGGSAEKPGSVSATQASQPPRRSADPTSLRGCLEEQKFKVKRLRSRIVRATRSTTQIVDGGVIDIYELPSPSRARAFARRVAKRGPVHVQVQIGRRVAIAAERWRPALLDVVTCLDVAQKHGR